MQYVLLKNIDVACDIAPNRILTGDLNMSEPNTE